MRLLIVQYNVKVVKDIQTNLLTEGFDLDIVCDGESALWHANEGHYSAIIIDILLPRVNGISVCQELRNNENRTPILMLTTKSTLDDEIKSLEAGADDFLRIPFVDSLLVARVNALVRRRRKRRVNDDISCGTFSYNQKNRKFIFDKDEISLTTREGSVFEMLLLAEGDTVPKQTLLDNIWGLDFTGNPNIVDVYIGYLRRKLEEECNDDVVQTVRGIGYRLEV